LGNETAKNKEYLCKWTNYGSIVLHFVVWFLCAGSDHRRLFFGGVTMAGAEEVEGYQIHHTHGFHVFDAIPFAPFQT
jgi:hypothetical protein